jgi:hypothetical protein
LTGITQGQSPFSAVTVKGQVTVPKRIRDALDIHPGRRAGAGKPLSIGLIDPSAALDWA